MSERGTAWSVTINNPTPDDEIDINSARQRKGWTVIGQLEKGEEGTPHYQLLVKTPQTRFTQLKKAFPRAHIEKARNMKALETYVQKDETRIGEIPTSEFHPNLEKFWFLICNLIPRQVVSEITGTYEEDMLRALDVATSRLIQKGYHVETLAVNPQMRSAWKKFALYIHVRCSLEIDRQTDRLAREAAVPETPATINLTECIDVDGPDSEDEEDEEDSDEETVASEDSDSSESSEEDNERPRGSKVSFRDNRSG